MKTTMKFLSIFCFLLVFAACSDDDSSVDDDGPDADFGAELYVTSNTTGNITKYETDDMTSQETETYLTLSSDSEGVFYNDQDDALTVVSRSMLQLNSYTDIELLDDGGNLNIDFSSTANLESPRDLAVNGDIYVVSDNADVDDDPNTDDGRLFVYTRAADGFTLRNTVTVNFAVWGIEFVGNDLYVVVDKTSDIAVFNNFDTTFTADATEEPSKRITVEGIVRTHGLAFDGGTMILTDVGDAASDTDGGFHIITDFESKFDATADGGTLVVANNQVRVAGSSTFLGNPVAAEYDADSNTVFIAERANGGGRVLAFTNADGGGNLAPSVNNQLEGASSLYFEEE
ncbi:hypothetical protein [Luteirhabdus pelagi]|uniref:hypothetical protein n=1 Tax=Luteirhabdus pelagi TaxID=2792783 RepID=UPI001F3DB91E|nr:hypothetical protein [Luteirhabdus pelagi]